MGQRETLDGWGPGTAIAHQPGRTAFGEVKPGVERMIRELSPMGRQEESVRRMQPTAALRPAREVALATRRRP